MGILGRHLQENSALWDGMEKDLFICAEDALENLSKVTKLIQTYVNLTTLARDADGRLRRVQIVDMDESVRTFIPFSALLGGVLSMVHQVDVPTRLRFYAFINASLPVALEAYPKVSQPVKLAAAQVQITQTSRFAELGKALLSAQNCIWMFHAIC